MASTPNQGEPPSSSSSSSSSFSEDWPHRILIPTILAGLFTFYFPRRSKALVFITIYLLQHWILGIFLFISWLLFVYITGVAGGGVGLVSKHRKVHGLANISASYAANLAIVTGCYCGISFLHSLC